MRGDNFYNSHGWRTLSAMVCHPGARCVRCGSPDNLNTHHKIPRAFGGQDVLSNLEPVCDSCHPRAESVSRLSALLSGYAPPPSRPKRVLRAQPRRVFLRAPARLSPSC